MEKVEYTHAVVGTWAGAGTGSEEARRQHECYVRLLRELNLEVVELEGGELFLEPCCVLCNGTALLTTTQTQKTKALREVLEKTLGQVVLEVTDKDAKLNGSDVLFTGRELFVGISESSNEAGACAVADAFPEFPCTLIKSAPGSGPLKRYISVGGRDVLCVGGSREAQDLVKRIEREASFPYQTLTVPEDAAANCLYLNGTLVHRAIEEIPQSFKVFCERIEFSRRSICFSELAGSSSGLTSCSLLLRKPHI